MPDPDGKTFPRLMGRLAAGLVAAVAFPALAEPPVVRSAGSYAVAFDKGLARRMVIRPRAGGRIVIDRFVDDPDLAKAEARDFSGECTSAACRATCFYARNARPFRRLTGFDAQGHKLWTWLAPPWLDNGERSGYELNCSGLADALSPDGHYLAVDIFGEATDLGSGVLRVAAPPGDVAAKGLGSTKDAFVGWKPGAPATIIVEHDAGVVHDGPPEYVETRLSR